MLEEIKITHILGMKAESKNKNILNITIKEEIKDKKLIKKKGINYLQYLIKIDFPSTNDSKNFISSFKKLTANYKQKFQSKKK